MDRRSWLWRRKSSDKSSGETESLGSGSGSLSSPSERFSDEQQAYLNPNIQSPEVTSKAVPHDEDANDSVKILSEKLSAAVASISEKEELVKQHAKVAEEAVTGWERAENEVNALKLQLDTATKKNSSLEDRIVHLDGALKECLRQLRQVKEEQDQRIQEAISNKSHDTEPKSFELQGELADLHAQLESANAKIEAAVSLESDLRLKLGSVEKENSSLKLELHSRLEELQVRTLERDLSTERAETASKQHLESIKRVAKLEAECRRLKAMARKATSFNDQKSFSASPCHVDSFTDSRSDSGELGQLIIETASSKSAPAIGLMDDFLEMERLAAIPVRENRSSSLGSVISNEKHNDIGSDNASLKAELQAMMNRTAELEEKIEMVEAEKVEYRLTLAQCQDKLKVSEDNLGKLQAQYNECQNQLKMSQAQLRDANKKLGTLQAELDLASELRQAIDLELDDANVRREEAEKQCKVLENESKILLSRVSLLEHEAEKERGLYAEASAKSRALENELSRIKHESDTWRSQLASMKGLKENIEQEHRTTDAMKGAAESQLKAVQAETRALLAKIGSLESEAENERRLSAEFGAKCRNLENELSRMKHEAETWQSQLDSANDLKEAVRQELQMTSAQKEEVESQLKAVQAEAKSLLARVGSLEHEMEKERSLSAEFAAKCRKLNEDLSIMKSEANIQFAPLSKEELNKRQEKELAVAANKLAECQKTIASLGNQLKSLGTLDDLFLDSDKLLEIPEKESQLLGSGMESTCLPSSNRLTVDSGSLSSEAGPDTSTIIKEDGQPLKDSKAVLSSLSLDKSLKNGLGKFFPRARNTVQSQNS